MQWKVSVCTNAEELKPQYEPPFPYETQERCPRTHSFLRLATQCSLLDGHDGDCIVERDGRKWKVTPNGLDDPGYHFPEQIHEV